MNFARFIFLIGMYCFEMGAYAQTQQAASPPATKKPAGITDPRFGSQLLNLIYRNGTEVDTHLGDALLIYARWDTKPPNTLIGVPGSFTDEQIITALKKFFREWHPPANDTARKRPQLILAAQNWGCGVTLYETLKSLSAEFDLDVYMLYPVIDEITSTPKHPTPNDKRLSELLKGT